MFLKLTWTMISDYYHFIFLDKSRTSQLGRPICTVIPTYLVLLCPISLEIPTYPNIGCPLCTFSNRSPMNSKVPKNSKSSKVSDFLCGQTL